MVQLQLAALDPAAQPSGQLEPVERVGRAEAIDMDAAAGGLCLVHRGVGVLAQRLGRLRVVREQADADAASTSSSAAPSANGACIASAIR